MGKNKKSGGSAPQTAKATKAKTAAAAEAAAADIAALFETTTKKPAASGAPASKKKAGADAPADPNEKAAVAAPASSGLYQARPVEEAMAVSDDAFFAETSEAKEEARKAAAAAGGRAGKKGKAPKVTGTTGIEPGMRVISEDDLVGFHTTNPNAGNTENCPFDCDCCF
jgi:hypothetical protein